MKWTRHIEILQKQLRQEAETKTGWERQLHKRAADALQQNLNLRKLYIETGEGVGRWKHMSTASGSAPRVRRKRGQECKSGEGTKNARNKDNSDSDGRRPGTAFSAFLGSCRRSGRHSRGPALNV